MFTTRACMHCGKTSAVALKPEQTAVLAAGKPIQDVIPDVSPNVRELLISGTHPKCWEVMFA
ncbi:hypothetical protein GCM10025865_33790 (plasmid) [Paraoerskovia sediminicola]|uniref:Uncharacterized protein n=1 Tax=Paraoerskovia sediminicola TaxID=1138587 RepID=A0ABM8G7A1_9CELL|nr:hypothetical protein [Paraoerskovia sediminicola]BDZ44036.1 hypothetical protein GCM10025865_33350 [Paraoerskovia sediminicola]BDZ44080.1 hypothetical protein GCM10025865_33790 [Paraoerskovia sediminicola]